MKKDSVQKIILVLLLGVIVGYFYYSNALSPKLQEIGAQKEQIAEQQERLAYLKMEAQRQDEHNQSVQELQQEYQTLKDQIPPVLSKQQLIYYFYNISAQFGISEGLLSFGETAVEGEYTKLDISFSGMGTIANVLALCEALQNSTNPRITLDSINVSPGIVDSSFNMKLIGYSERVDANPDAEKEFMNVPFGISIPTDIVPSAPDEI